MAAPVKSFTDPVNLSRLGPDVPAPQLVPLQPFGVAASLPRVAFALPVLSPFPRMMAALAVPQIKIPPPPMGRLVLSTFPPIYKERGAGARPVSGQIQPRGLK